MEPPTYPGRRRGKFSSHAPPGFDARSLPRTAAHEPPSVHEEAPASPASTISFYSVEDSSEDEEDASRAPHALSGAPPSASARPSSHAFAAGTRHALRSASTTSNAAAEGREKTSGFRSPSRWTSPTGAQNRRGLRPALQLEKGAVSSPPPAGAPQAFSASATRQDARGRWAGGLAEASGARQSSKSSKSAVHEERAEKEATRGDGRAASSGLRSTFSGLPTDAGRKSPLQSRFAKPMSKSPGWTPSATGGGGLIDLIRHAPALLRREPQGSGESERLADAGRSHASQNDGDADPGALPSALDTSADASHTGDLRRGSPARDRRARAPTSAASAPSPPADEATKDRGEDTQWRAAKRKTLDASTQAKPCLPVTREEGDLQAVRRSRSPSAFHLSDEGAIIISSSSSARSSPRSPLSPLNTRAPSLHVAAPVKLEVHAQRRDSLSQNKGDSLLPAEGHDAEASPRDKRARPGPPASRANMDSTPQSQSAPSSPAPSSPSLESSPESSLSSSAPHTADRLAEGAAAPCGSSAPGPEHGVEAPAAPTGAATGSEVGGLARPASRRRKRTESGRIVATEKRPRMEPATPEEETDTWDSTTLARRVSARVRQLPFYGTAGKITKVELKDFLNHRQLTWTPGSNCNVVTGMNGSGKSALARAILFCCGAEGVGSGAASSASSAAGDRVKLYEFIRQYWTDEGPRMAEVKVTFSNFRDAPPAEPRRARRSVDPASGTEATDAPDVLNSLFQTKREILQDSDDETQPSARRNSASAAASAADTPAPAEAAHRAYQPDVWGTTLTVTRRVWKKRVASSLSSREGDGEAAEGEKWATDRSEFFLSAGREGTVTGLQPVKKEKIQQILRHFGLDFTNPAVYLTQEKSKTLLVSAKEEELYAFFTEVTGLDEACSELRALTAKLYETETELAKYTSSLGPFQDRVEVWRRAQAELRHLDKQEEALARLSALLLLLQLRERREEEARRAAALTALEREAAEEREKEIAASEHLAAIGGRRTAEERKRQQEELERVTEDLQTCVAAQRELRQDAKRAAREKLGKDKAKEHEEMLQRQAQQRLQTAEETNAARRAQFAAAAAERTAADLQRHLALVADRQKQQDDAVATHEAHKAAISALQRELEAKLSVREEAEVSVLRQEDSCRLAKDFLRQTHEERAEGQRQRRLGGEQRLAHMQRRRATWLARKAAREEERKKRREAEAAQAAAGASRRSERSTAARDDTAEAPEAALAPSCPWGWRSDLYTPPSSNAAFSSASRGGAPPLNLDAVHAELGELVRKNALDAFPLGPVGEFLFVLREACEAAGAPQQSILALVERHLRPQLHTWVVASKRDQRVLSEFFRGKQLARIPRIVAVNPDAPPYPDRLLRGPSGSVFTVYKALCAPAPQAPERPADGRGPEMPAASPPAAFSPSLRLVNRRRSAAGAAPEAASTGAAFSAFRSSRGGRLPHQVLRFLVDVCRIESVALVPSHRCLAALLLQAASRPESRDADELYTGAEKAHFKEGYDWSGGRHLKRSFAGAEAMPGPAGPQGSAGPQARFVRLVAAEGGRGAGARLASAVEEDDSAEEAAQEEELRRLVRENEEIRRQDARTEREEEEAIREAETKLEEAKKELERRKEEAKALLEDSAAVDELRSKKQAMVAEEVRLAQTVSSAREALADAEQELGEIRMISEQLQRAAESATQAVQAEVERQLALLRQTVEEKKTRVAQLAQEAQALEAQAAELDQRAEEKEREIEALEQRKTELEKKRRNLQAAREEGERRLAAHAQTREEKEMQVQAAQKELAKCRAQLEVFLQEHFQGKEIPAKLPEGEAHQCAAEAEGLRRDIFARRSRMKFDPRIVEAKLHEAELAYEMKLEQMRSARETFEVCRRRLIIRKNKYTKGLNAVTSEVVASFENHLAGVIRRRARMRVDHEARAVRIETSDESRQAHTHTKTLSGGEKSAVQLAFLIALARRSSSPLHIFDEVDVFMDENNRIKNFNLLLQFGLESEPDKQLFLITPHSEISQFIHDNYEEKDVFVQTVAKVASA
ncbi:RecF/RecN/SMC N terminal domain-containing protein [Besnoitia besnoiti]|uniref:RecF/RecN/SMC N terminal domain-containing protein n=1 Tax=Besnoitia besnoiti TaxID=94643 RepID=A0A2A9ME43_BESBE|nr:RecF/RecN/SMC N terminal domain-containing protein [Besnoitia besnoiti]PFH33897.1 RecF/RecN/SMC N terminal domain-containing protein [Besnoitia besnoiti]